MLKTAILNCNNTIQYFCFTVYLSKQMQPWKALDIKKPTPNLWDITESVMTMVRSYVVSPCPSLPPSPQPQENTSPLTERAK